MVIKKMGNLHKVESSEGGKFYTVNLAEESCNCPSFTFRKKECKHLAAAREFAEKEGSEKKIHGEILDFVSKQKEADVVTLIGKYGEAKIDEMIRLGELIEEKGKVRLLE